MARPGNYRSVARPGNYRSAARPGNYRFLEKCGFFGIFDFLGPAPVLGVLDIELSIPEVW